VNFLVVGPTERQTYAVNERFVEQFRLSERLGATSSGGSAIKVSRRGKPVRFDPRHFPDEMIAGSRRLRHSDQQPFDTISITCRSFPTFAPAAFGSIVTPAVSFASNGTSNRLPGG